MLAYAGIFMTLAAALSGCRSPLRARRSADAAAYAALSKAQQQALGITVPISIETPADTFRRRLIETQELPVASILSADPSQLEDLPRWNPELRVFSDAPPPAAAGRAGQEPAPVLSLTDALQLAAHGNREYQGRKETLFLTALALDVEEEAFRNTLAGMLGGRAETAQGDETVSATGVESSLSASRMLRSGARIAAALTVDLVNLLTQNRASAFGIRMDTSITIPLGRGAGRHVVMEPLTQAQRDLLTAVWEFEHSKAEFAIDIATRYFGVLAAEDQVRNAAENFERLQTNARRARRMAEAGRLPEIQVDQAVQEALRASSRSVAAVRRHADALDQFKVFLGLPPDARLQLDRNELDKLTTEVAGKVLADPATNATTTVATTEPGAALKLAFANRLDLRATATRVQDAQRKVIIAANGLRTETSLSADASFGERRSTSGAGQGDAQLRFDEGRYSTLLKINAPWRRVAERNALRRSLVNLEQAVRKLQETEDRVKLQVRGDLRGLQQARENLLIQADAMRIARRRVSSSDLFLDAGRAVIRDVLEAQDALLAAQNAFTDAVVEYRLTELGYQRNLGLLRVDADGLWTERQLTEINHEEPQPAF